MPKASPTSRAIAGEEHQPVDSQRTHLVQRGARVLARPVTQEEAPETSLSERDPHFGRVLGSALAGGHVELIEECAATEHGLLAVEERHDTQARAFAHAVRG